MSDESKPVNPDHNEELDGPPTVRIRTPRPSKAPDGAGTTVPPKPAPLPDPSGLPPLRE